jgi:hypothetical protein
MGVGIRSIRKMGEQVAADQPPGRSLFGRFPPPRSLVLGS